MIRMEVIQIETNPVIKHLVKKVNSIVKLYFLIKRDYERNNIFRYKEKNIILYKQGLYCILKLSQN